MADVTTTITYRERFFTNLRDYRRDAPTSSEGYDTYQEAVDAAAKSGAQSFEIIKQYVRVDA